MKFEFSKQMQEYMAAEIAAELHGEQYFNLHIRRVVTELEKLDCWHFLPDAEQKHNARIAAYLHDVVEDTKMTADDLRKYFNEEIVSIVESVTDEPGANRKERKAKTYLKTKQNPIGVMVKIADRIANIKRGIGERNKSKLSMYLKEAEEFQNHFYDSEVKKHDFFRMGYYLLEAKAIVDEPF